MPLISNSGTATVYKQSTQPSGASEGDLWYDTVNDLLKTFDGSSWNNTCKLSFSNATLVTHSESLPDYTQPSAAVATSEAIVEDSPEESNNFESYANDAAAAVDFPTTNATAAAVIASTDKLTVDHQRGSTNAAYLTHDLTGAIMTDEKFVIELRRVNMSVKTGGQIAFIGMSSGLGASSAALDRAGLQLGSSDSSIGYKAEVTDGGAVGRAVKEDAPNLDTDYWIDIICDGSDVVINVYSDAGKTNLVATSTESIGSAINFRYFIISGDTAAGSSERIAFTIDEIVMYASQETGSITHTASKAVDDDTAEYWQSDSEANPAIYVNCGSSKNLLGLAIYLHANSTETSVKLRV